jgi:hypothetical protein
MVIDDTKKVDAIASAASLGFFTGRLATWAAGKFAGEGTFFFKHATAIGWGVGAAVGLAIFLMMYKSESTEVVKFSCDPWEAPIGGNDCEKCNQQGILPCSEYQCRALGQACKLLNVENEKEAKCVWVNRQDVTVPEITAWDKALLDKFKYDPKIAVSPPDRGVRVVNTESTTGCAKAFTPLKFGIITNEPSKCKVDYQKKQKFEDMQFYFGGSSLYAYNHSQTLSLPGPNALGNETPIIQNDGNYQLFVRCMDANGNTNPANFVFQFCVEKGPDTTAPLIVSTSVINGMPIGYNQTSLPLEVYVNEPSSCKWSHLDQVYDKMENAMQCSSSVFEMNAQMLYKCSTTLTGLVGSRDNEFYFRCKDQPSKPESDRNVNQESLKFILKGSKALVINWVKPNETIRDSTSIVKVTLEAETSSGYKEGEASCFYSQSGTTGSYIKFFNTDSFKHSQDLFLAAGNYSYFIKCLDLGGNSDTKTTSFKVETDSQSPVVVRAYHEETNLKIITNEKATCVYSKDSCNYLFKDGITMTVVNDKEHFTEWNTNSNSYIKCKDEYGNEPLPNQCSIIARPFEIFTSQVSE